MLVAAVSQRCVRCPVRLLCGSCSLELQSEGGLHQGRLEHHHSPELSVLAETHTYSWRTMFSLCVLNVLSLTGYLGVKLTQRLWLQLVVWGFWALSHPESGVTRNTRGSFSSDSKHKEAINRKVTTKTHVLSLIAAEVTCQSFPVGLASTAAQVDFYGLGFSNVTKPKAEGVGRETQSGQSQTGTQRHRLHRKKEAFIKNMFYSNIQLTLNGGVMWPGGSCCCIGSGGFAGTSASSDRSHYGSALLRERHSPLSGLRGPVVTENSGKPVSPSIHRKSTSWEQQKKKVLYSWLLLISPACCIEAEAPDCHQPEASPLKMEAESPVWSVKASQLCLSAVNSALRQNHQPLPAGLKTQKTRRMPEKPLNASRVRRSRFTDLLVWFSSQ